MIGDKDQQIGFYLMETLSKNVFSSCISSCAFFMNILPIVTGMQCIQVSYNQFKF